MLVLRAIVAVFRVIFTARAHLIMENLALRQQLIVLKRRIPRPTLRHRDRIFWLWLARTWEDWRNSLILGKPETVVRWHRQGFKYYWTWKSRRKGGRPAVAPEVRDLIRRMSRANPLWGAPRIHGELLKLGIGLSQPTVAKYACGGYVMKGTATCQKFLLAKEPLEKFVEVQITERVQTLIGGEGEALLRQYIAKEIATQDGPRREAARLRARVSQIDRKADILLEGVTDETQAFVNRKLRDLATEKRRLQQRLQELELASPDPIDADAVLVQGLKKVQDLPRRMKSSRLEKKKAFVHDFIDGITVFPDERRLEVRIRKIPASLVPRPGYSSVRLVAGAGLESGQMEKRHKTGTLAA
jgi:hypothetical protein